MFKYLTFLFVFLTASTMAESLNNNGDIVQVSFPDNTVLVYQCSAQASGHVNLAFLDREGAVHPFVVKCGVQS